MLVGPQLSYRKAGRVTPFGRVLIGFRHESIDDFITEQSKNHFVFGLGGGLDVSVTPKFGIRVVQVDWLHSDDGYAPNDVRITFGVVANF